MIPLGAVAQDTISGFEGVVVCRSEWLYGCVRLTVQPREMHDGKPVDTQTFDEPQLINVTPDAEADAEAEAEAEAEADPIASDQVTGREEKDVPAGRGGPRPDPVRHPDLHVR